ncbi:protein OSB2, chloroplastic-like [Andrographis paniculata]|uniref:protein OSB2, chloroplastic-like n=1 Tax=Andrographis paniculata TaxID=175694 RepID=UPI0021E817ED|nr:protein OSB2, chloroplastic-like [Andrographis paniculata]
MNLLARSKSLTRIRSFVVRQLDLYSTKTADSIPKTVKLTRARTQKASGSSKFSQGVKKQNEARTVWPRPTSIPYQAKMANSLNLIGYVKAPVRFDAAADGKHFAAVLISPENSDGEKSSSLIPVVCEGDLAHAVAYHVKENDRVFVSGQLRAEPLGFTFSDSVGGLHVVTENLKYVEGIDSGNDLDVQIGKQSSGKSEEVRKSMDKHDLNLIVQHLFDHLKSILIEKDNAEAVEVKPAEEGDENKQRTDRDESWNNLLIRSHEWWDFRSHKANGLVKRKFPDFRHKNTGKGLWINTAPEWALLQIKMLKFDVKSMEANPVEGGGNKSEYSSKKANPVEGGGKKSENKFMKANPVKGGGKKSENKREDSWKHLVENPKKWWDNRLTKKSSKWPDFKHKETGEALWLQTAPDQILSKLPTLEDGKNASNGKKKNGRTP